MWLPGSTASLQVQARSLIAAESLRAIPTPLQFSPIVQVYRATSTPITTWFLTILPIPRRWGFALSPLAVARRKAATRLESASTVCTALILLVATCLASEPQQPPPSHGKQSRRRLQVTSRFRLRIPADDRDSALTKTCATSLITTGSPPSFLTLACFDIRTRIAEVEPGAARVTPMPERGLEDPDPVSDLAYHVKNPLVSQVLTDVDTYPFITITEVYASTSSGDAALATDIPLSSSADRTGTVTLTTQKSSTSASRWQTTVQPTPANTSSNSTPGARGPSRTAIVAGGLFGTIAFLALSITSVDFLVRRRKKNRCRHSFPSSSSSDNEALEHKKEEPQMPAYGYYGTNRAGTIPKGSKALEASAEPVELPAEGVADHRE